MLRWSLFSFCFLVLSVFCSSVDITSSTTSTSPWLPRTVSGQRQPPDHLIGWPVTAPRVTNLRLVCPALIFSTRIGRSRPFYLIPTPESESHPAKGVGVLRSTFGDWQVVRFLQPSATFSSFLSLWGFGHLSAPEGGRPREAVNARF